MRIQRLLAWGGMFCGLAVSSSAWGQNIAPYIPNYDPIYEENLTIEEDYRVPEPRSVFTRRDRPADELDRPRESGRNSHRGFEVRNDRGVYISTTSTEEAQLAAEIVGQTWGSLDKVANHFTAIQKQPDFALGAVQVMISDDQPIERNEPLPVWIPGRFQSTIILNTSEGRPTLEEQIPLLRAATAYLYMHAADFDKELPQWAVDGFAQSVVLQHDGPEGLESLADVPLAVLRGQGLKQFQQVPIEFQERLLAEEDVQEEPSGSLVPFMLFADDAAHAPEFFATLREALRERAEIAPFVREEIVRQRQTGFQNPPLALDDEAVHFQAEFDRWAENPDAGVPQFVGLNTDDVELAQTQRELFVLLKLAQKVVAPPSPASNISDVKTKVVEFTKNGPVERQAKPAATTAAKTAQIRDMRQLLTALNDNPQGWTTVDTDGTIILSSDREAVAELAERYEGNVNARKEGDHWVWNYQLSGGRVLAGWLAPHSSEDPRLISHFELRPVRK